MSDTLNQEIQELQLKIEELNKQIETVTQEKDNLAIEMEKLKQIATNAQSQYVLLKYDFDGLINRTQKEKAESETKALIDNVKKIISFVEQLKKSIEIMPEEIKNNSWSNGIIMTYDNLMKKLNSMGIFTVDSIGQEPNHDYHEPVGFEETDESMKGKITKEFESCYVYRKDDTEIVIKPSKVIVGN